MGFQSFKWLKSEFLPSSEEYAEGITEFFSNLLQMEANLVYQQLQQVKTPSEMLKFLEPSTSRVAQEEEDEDEEEY